MRVLIAICFGCGDAPHITPDAAPIDGAKRCSWRQHPNNPLVRSDAALDGLMGDPSVIAVPAGYAMYYGAIRGDLSAPDTVRIFRATSADGLTWTRTSVPVLEPTATSWDSVKVEAPSVVRLPDGRVRMYYAGSAVADSEAGFDIGIAESSDGITFTRRASPVLVRGSTDSFDALSILDPFVTFDEATGDYRMYYAGMSSALELAIGSASSLDGISWTKQGVVLRIDVERTDGGDPGVIGPSVVRVGNELEIAYAPVHADGVVGPLWHAVSQDGGATWRKDTMPIIAIDQMWTAQGASSPSLLVDGDRVRMWFTGTRTDGSTYIELGIGVAERVCE